MRERHFPRVCRACRAPMARQEDICWRCGAPVDVRRAPWPPLQEIAGGMATHIAGAPDPSIAVAAADSARAVADARVDADRWISDGGRVAAEAAVPLGAVIGRG
jgi:hypothetical protein